MERMCGALASQGTAIGRHEQAVQQILDNLQSLTLAIQQSQAQGVQSIVDNAITFRTLAMESRWNTRSSLCPFRMACLMTSRTNWHPGRCRTFTISRAQNSPGDAIS
ncbi:hypothetical protein SKAU_G00193110 [Synaphobranchus kaupii]|uniref:Uncharacterized protein n=1 Tax=Synaphobranchus kaupii TaxID=118154 RepID=A0A9Q1FE09_SYNKA|nr:hypothetical protein SKAU_G00193110 [Synaphobranchus kaupii]